MSGDETREAGRVRHHVENGVARVVFDRPQARNAFTFAMYEELHDLCGALEADDAVRVVVLEGAGGKAFAAGTDIAAFRDVRTAEDALAYEVRIERVLSRLESLPKPTIAMIAGACTGGGAAIAACCDLRIAEAGARIGFPIARTLGNCLSVRNLARLATLVGPATVKEMIFTARLLSAAEACAKGFVTEVAADPDALAARVDELAATIAGHAPLTLAATKRGLALAASGEIDGAGDDLVVGCYTSGDFREGMEAFLAKRKPVWQGR
ncbi:enoyl-CoA hydratase [Salinarimonas ramus]|uniref:Enoyl-CoA hydratase n=1 Tax=Salinarimonas ramus TaxID=690164 RepID=A0A917QEU3_9HYPH|nr:enoyl-CoA hydratase [Salinarimonas ramus]GGK48051.1 enoyl-CoA hydratase [Salinarimonas ramus]